MKDKRRSRLLEWGKSLLILLLLISAVYLLGRAQISGRMMDGVRDLLDRPTEIASTEISLASSSTVHPVRLAICRDGLRYGVQYNQTETDSAFSSLSVLFSEALGSAGAPEAVSEREWQQALCRAGIYADFLYPVPFYTLAVSLGAEQGNPVLTGTVRRICVAADEDGGVSLFYIEEESETFYACVTTLSSEFHLDAAIAEWSPNGAQFAFEVSGMAQLDPYTLLTTTPQPLVYQAGNPLLEDRTRVSQMLSALSFKSQGELLDPAVGGQIVENNDSLRLSEDGVVTFHMIGDSNFRFALMENSTQGALEYVQALAENTIGAWCGQARICLAEVEETADGAIIIFQYSLNGVSVALPEGSTAARFVVRNGVVTDFSLYFRSYKSTEQTSLVLPVVQAAAAMGALDAKGKELALLYQDFGAEQLMAGWFAV